MKTPRHPSHHSRLLPAAAAVPATLPAAWIRASPPHLWCLSAPPATTTPCSLSTLDLGQTCRVALVGRVLHEDQGAREWHEGLGTKAHAAPHPAAGPCLPQRAPILASRAPPNPPCLLARMKVPRGAHGHSHPAALTWPPSFNQTLLPGPRRQFCRRGLLAPSGKPLSAPPAKLQGKTA